VQAHYLGYFASTGLTEMDYWIGDSVLLPAEEDSHYCERLWRLPRAWVSYQGRDDAPAPCWEPQADGTVWLGSFNSLNKVTELSITLWAKILHHLPQARLMLKTKELAQPENVRRIEADFLKHGIPPQKIALRGDTPDWISHMALYNQLDFALDPVGGIGGGTTTCDALWMGLPTVTLAGMPMGQRMTASMLHSIDHPEWIANSESEYIEKIVTLATNVDLRQRLRAKQREKIRSSPLFNSQTLAQALEETYEAMFDTWWHSPRQTH
jgi:predicted O-linked N-acetylglucosamine transferase (SPINDLY family)